MSDPIKAALEAASEAARVNGDGAAFPIISQEAARAMLDALRLALPELREDLETVVDSNTTGGATWSANQPLPADLDEEARLLAEDKKAAHDAVVAAIAWAEGR